MANEKRLIYLDHALQAVSENYRSDMPKHELDMHSAIRKRLKAMPTVDAMEVVHGEWFVIEDDYFDLVELKCSVCGESWGFEDYEDCIPQNYHYCPNCGAKMDGV